MVAETTKLGVIQLECKLSRESGNMRRAVRYIEQAINDGAKLICLPESFLTSGDILNVAAVAVPIPGECTDTLCELARKGGAYIVAGLFEKEGDHYYSSAVLITPKGEIQGTYRRIHCFQMEKQYLDTGDRFAIFDTEVGRIGLIQGFDLNFPEACRDLYQREVDIIICSALIPDQFSYVTSQLLTTRAIENQCYIVFVSGVGANAFAGFRYMGKSAVIADPLFLEEELFDFVDGDERILECGDSEEYRSVELNIDRLRKYREKKSLVPDLEPEVYARSIQSFLIKKRHPPTIRAVGEAR